MLPPSQDGTTNTLFWDCSPGEFNWFYDRDETAYIIDGYAILDEGLPTERSMRAGDVVYFPAGSQARWRVIDHFYKVAFVRQTLPKPLMMAINGRRKIKQMLGSHNQGGEMFDLVPNQATVTGKP